MAKKNDVDIVTEEKIAKGGVLVKFYFDIQDKDKSKLQPLLIDLINNGLMKEHGIVYVYGSIEEPIESHGVYVTSGEITALFDNFMPLVTVAFKYAPAGVEILKPDREMVFKVSQLQSLLMDISQVSLDYSKLILEKVLKPEELEDIEKKLENRAMLGKKFIEESNNNSKNLEEKK
ncbi:MAG: hypothetical protein ACP5UN_00125 [Candidatus Micrarchaeia archaeon]